MTREDPWKAQERRNRLLAKAAHEAGGYMALGHKLALAAQEKEEAELRAAGHRQLLLPLREGWPIEQARIDAVQRLAARILATADVANPAGLHVMGWAKRPCALLVEMWGDVGGLADLRPDVPSTPDAIRRDDAAFLDRALHKEIRRLGAAPGGATDALGRTGPWSGTRTSRSRKERNRETAAAGVAMLAVALLLFGSAIAFSPAGSGEEDVRTFAIAASVVVGLVSSVLLATSLERPSRRTPLRATSVEDAATAPPLGTPEDHEAGLLAASGGSADRMRTALTECRRTIEIASSNPEATATAEHLRRHLASLAELHDRAAELCDDEDQPALVENLVQGVETLAREAVAARHALARSAGDELETELRYLRMRIDDPLPPLPR